MFYLVKSQKVKTVFLGTLVSKRKFYNVISFSFLVGELVTNKILETRKEFIYLICEKVNF